MKLGHLSGADGNVEAHLAHRLQDDRGKEIGSCNHHGVVSGVAGLGELGPVGDGTIGVWVLTENSAVQFRADLLQRIRDGAHDDLHTQGIATSLSESDILRVASLSREVAEVGGRRSLERRGRTAS